MKYIFKLGLLFIFSLLLSCAHIQRAHERDSLPRASFVEIITKRAKKSCKVGVCLMLPPHTFATSSGSIIRTDPDGSYVIGSNHVCDIKKMENTSKVSISFYATGPYGTSHKAHILTTDAINDLCVMYVPGLKGTPIRMRDYPPRYGEKVYNLASPGGIARPPVSIPVFMGYYSGRDGRWDLYTVPATGGSSGSPIVDVDGHMVGIVQAHLRGFNHLTISTHFYNIKKMIDKITSGRLSMKVLD